MILVTGGTGLLGAHLLYGLLKKGRPVRALVRNREKTGITEEIFNTYPDGSLLFPKIEWADGDVLDLGSLEDAFEGVSEVYHCAAKVSFHPRDEEVLMENNIRGTANMATIAAERKVRKFCHVSSIATAARSINGQEVDESMEWQFKKDCSSYGISKYYAENEVWRASEEGLDVIIINPCTIIGPGNWDTGSSALFKRVKEGISFYTEGSSAFVDVRDVVEVSIRLMDSEIVNDRFFVTGDNRRFKEVLQLMARELKAKQPSIRAGKILSGLAWRMEMLKYILLGKEPVVTRESARIANEKQKYSNKKLVETLGYHFRTLEESIAYTAGFLN